MWRKLYNGILVDNEDIPQVSIKKEDKLALEEEKKEGDKPGEEVVEEQEKSD